MPRVWSAVTLGLALVTVALAIVVAVAHFPNGLAVVACVARSRAARPGMASDDAAWRAWPA